MGIWPDSFKDLFDFDFDGKFGLGDEITLAWLIHMIGEEEKKQRREESVIDDWLNNYYRLLDEAEQQSGDPAIISARKKATEEEKLRKTMNEIYTKKLQIRIPISHERKEEILEVKKQYQGLLEELHSLRPEDDGAMIFIDWKLMINEFEGSVRTADEIYQILSGNLSLNTDPQAQKAAELAQLREELETWESDEPSDPYSEAWDAWEDRRQELEDQIEELQVQIEDMQEELDWDELLESLESDADRWVSEDYVRAYEDATKIYGEAALAAEPLRRIILTAQRIIEKAQELARELENKVSDARWSLDGEEPGEKAPERALWQKRIEELDELSKVLDDIDCL